MRALESHLKCGNSLRVNSLRNHSLIWLRTLSQVDEKGNRAGVAGSYSLTLGGSQPEGDAANGIQTKDFTIAGTQEIPC